MAAKFVESEFEKIDRLMEIYTVRGGPAPVAGAQKPLLVHGHMCVCAAIRFRGLSKCEKLRA